MSESRTGVREGMRGLERNEDEREPKFGLFGGNHLRPKRVNVQRMECGSVRCDGVKQELNENRRG